MAKPMRKPIRGDIKRAIRTLYKPENLIAPIPAPSITAPIRPPISAWEELPRMPKYHVTKFQRIAPTRAARITFNVNTFDWTISAPIVLATVTPNKKGPRNSATAAIPSAVRGPKARDEIIVATILLASRIPFRKSKTSARAITRISSWGIVGNCHCEPAGNNLVLDYEIATADEHRLAMTGFSGLLHHDIGDDISRLVATVCCVREMPVHLAQLQHFDNVMNILGSCKEVGDCFAVDPLDSVLERLGALGMVDCHCRVLLKTLDRLIELICRILQQGCDPLHVRRGT